MGDVLTFAPRPKPTAPEIPEPLSDAELRVHLEDAAQTALDAADRIIAVLNRMDGDADAEDGSDAEPSLAAPENHHGAQVTWLRGNDRDREAETPETALPDMPAEPEPTPYLPLRWGGRGNVIAAASSVILDMMAGGQG